MPKVAHKRHIVKAITWRCLGTLDTVLLSWIITGDPLVGLQIGLFEVLTKMVLYYLHERFWLRIDYTGDVQKKHLFKTLTWRLVGTIDTIILGWVISGDPFTGLSIGLVEVLTKMVLYYLHERVWYNIDFGIEKNRRLKRIKSFRENK